MSNILHWGQQSTTDSALHYKLETAGHSESCGYCGLIHNGTCPRIKKMEYFENGTIKSIEFHSQYNQYNNQYNYSGYRGFSG